MSIAGDLAQAPDLVATLAEHTATADGLCVRCGRTERGTPWAGHDYREVSEWLGHADYATTLEARLVDRLALLAGPDPVKTATGSTSLR
jgi:hypothetical protein